MAFDWSINGDTILSGTTTIIGSGTVANPYIVNTLPKFILDEGGKNMETLYNVIIVSDIREILFDEKVVAQNEEKAKFRAGVYKFLDESGLELEDVTVLTYVIGKVKVHEELIN